MNNSPVYPENLDLNTPVTPEIRALWEQAWKDLKRRRNINLIWMLPFMLVFPLFLLILIISLCVLYPVQGVVFALIVCIVILLALLSIGETFSYIVSEDRRSARIKFHREWDSPSSIVREALKKHLGTAGESVGGLVMAISYVFCFGVIAPALVVVLFPGWLNQVFWLSGYRDIMRRHLDPAESSHQAIERGTDVLPSIELAGCAPGSDEEVNLAPDDSCLSVFGNKLELFPDGKVACKGGVSFDAQAKIEGMTINGMTLTRTDSGLLRVHFEGEDHAFFYNGSTWTKV